MAKANKTEHIKKALIESLEKSLGIVTTACKQVGIGRTTFYQYLKDDIDFANNVKEIENIALDFAESQLHKQIQNGNTPATIFYLKTKGKKRGYIERQEIQHDGTIKSTLIEWKPAEQELSNNAIDNSTTLSEATKDLESIRGEQEVAKQ